MCGALFAWGESDGGRSTPYMANPDLSRYDKRTRIGGDNHAQKMMELRPELSRLYAVSLQGEDVPVYHTAEADYAILVVCDDAPQRVQVQIRENFERLVIRPLKERDYTLENGTLTLTMRAGDKWSVELDGDLIRPLFLLCSRYIPKPADANHVFAAGTVTFIGRYGTGKRRYRVSGSGRDRTWKLPCRSRGRDHDHRQWVAGGQPAA